MATLAQLSEQRIASGLGAIVAEFVGASVPERLVAGRNAALASLRKYVPDFRYDVAAADDQVREIDAWAERNEAALSAIMASPAEQLPHQLQLQMGSSRAQSWILSSFTQAAAGLGPWTSGQVAKMAAVSDLINDTWAREDAAYRLDMFALVVKMDRDGALKTIFEPPPSTAGFGALPLWFIAVVIVIFAAAIVTGVVLWRRIELNNRLMRDICQRAYDDGKTDIVKHCIDATADLQVSGLERAAASVGTRIGTALIVAAAFYTGLKYGLPWARKELSRQRSRT